MPDSSKPHFNEDGTLTIPAAFIAEVLENPEVARAVRKRMKRRGETAEEAVSYLLRTGARRLTGIPDGAHGTGGARRG